jgi:hypothetical protein
MRNGQQASGNLRLRAGLHPGYQERLPQSSFQETILFLLKRGSPRTFFNNPPIHRLKVVDTSSLQESNISGLLRLHIYEQ